MAAYRTGPKTILLGIEMGGDEGKDIQRNAVYAKEGVPPLPDSCQRGRDVLVQLRNIIESEAVEEVSASFLRISRATFATYDGEYDACFSSWFRAKTSCESDRPFPG